MLSEEKQFLDSISLFADTQIPEDLVTRMPQVSELEGLLAFLSVKLKDNFSAHSGHKFRIRDINEKIDILRRQLAEISGPGKKLKREIVVDLTGAKPGNGEYQCFLYGKRCVLAADLRGPGEL